MGKPQENMWAQGVGRLEIQHEWKEPGREFVEVWGEVEIYNGAGLVHARNLRLKAIENMQLTCDPSTHTSADKFASKWIYEKGRKNNYASIYVWDLSTALADTGSCYVNFLAMGE